MPARKVRRIYLINSIKQNGLPVNQKLGGRCLRILNVVLIKGYLQSLIIYLTQLMLLYVMDKIVLIDKPLQQRMRHERQSTQAETGTQE